MQNIAVLDRPAHVHASHGQQHAPPGLRSWESGHEREAIPAGGTYRGDMPAAKAVPADDIRRVRFSEFVRRVLAAAKGRGMTVKQIEEATSVSKSTFYRWRDGSMLPKTNELRRFCEGLGAPISEAYAALGWSEQPAKRPSRPEPLIEDPDLRRLLHKLTSPNTPPAEKLLIRRTIRALAAAPEEKHPEE